jgi:ABC-type branched-subunit amino acid transport system permease subunit
VGGGTYILGPILGALVLNTLSEFLRPINELEPIVFALILIGAVLFLNNGLIGLVLMLQRRFRDVTAHIAGRKATAEFPRSQNLNG